MRTIARLGPGVRNGLDSAPAGTTAPGQDALSRVAWREWRWVVVVAGLIVAASALPYLTGAVTSTAEWSFRGALLDPVDYHSHLAKMWQGYRGGWQYHLLFTPEPHGGAFVQLYYLALGHLARAFGLSLPATYELARIVMGLVLLLVIYRFLALFVASIRVRRTAFLMATVVSGLGWLTESIAPTPPTGVSPMDFWLLDGYTYLAMLVMPHFSAASALLLSVFVLLLRRPEGPGAAGTILAVLASLALGVIHPYALLVADLVPLLYWGVEGLRTRRLNRRGILAIGVMGITQLPLLVYVGLILGTQPVWADWTVQNVTLSPPPGIYLLGYGALLLLGIAGAVAWARSGRPGLAFPLAWIGLVAVLVYLPWNLQRRFLEGVQVPLGLLAGIGMGEVLFAPAARQRGARLRWLAQALLIALLSMTNLYLTLGHTVAVAARSPEFFWRSDVMAGVDWLGANSAPDDTVLAGFTVGNLLPGRIGHRVVLGHWMETIDYEAKTRAVGQFFAAGTPPEERIGLLTRYGVAYVFYGPDERALGGFDPETAAYLEPVFARDQVTVYQVDLP